MGLSLLRPDTPVKNVPFVGPAYSKRLSALNIALAADLLYHLPFRYLDYSLVSSVNRLREGSTVTVSGVIASFKTAYTRSGKNIQTAVLNDKTGNIEAVWFNQRYLTSTLKPGTPVSLAGRVDRWANRLAFISPEHEIIRPESSLANIHTGRLVPVYNTTAGISSKWLRSRILFLLNTLAPKLADPLPATILKKSQLLPLKDALWQVHFPGQKQEAVNAKHRLAFEELFLLHLINLKRKADWQKQAITKKFTYTEDKIDLFRSHLPFILTPDQEKTISEIGADLKRSFPMNRLLQGDVGSGKTAVAAAAVYLAHLNQCQSALMAPTEILAQQHFNTLEQLLSPLNIKIAIITGKTKTVSTKYDLIIGTHALLHKRAQFSRLGLVIIDEQHRFGVSQRAKLIGRGHSPHVLTMTATPIPRTIALTLYGDLDLSLLTDKPPGRKEVKTWLVPAEKRSAAYAWIKKKLVNDSDQVFVICPFVEQSETLQSVKSAVNEHQQLSRIFKRYRLGLLHGRLKSAEKEAALRDFSQGKTRLLVATPVVEVGIDIPQATILIIEGAERFGLAQLHQLRGRVGRSQKQSYCLLFTDLTLGRPLQRLKSLEKIHDGGKLAELDLKMRGPGEIYGVQQHGFTQLKIASFQDSQLIRQTRLEAQQVLPKISRYPHLQALLKKDKIAFVKPN